MKCNWKSLMMVMALVCVLTGCVTGITGSGTGQTGNPVWTYNMQQALLRSAGDVAVVLMLDQGVSVADATTIVNTLIVLVKSSDVTIVAVNAKIATLAKQYPLVTTFVDRLNSAIPVGIGTDAQLSPEAKADLLAFLQDGALYGISTYQPKLQLKMVPGNANLKLSR